MAQCGNTLARNPTARRVGLALRSLDAKRTWCFIACVVECIGSDDDVVEATLPDGLQAHHSNEWCEASET
eukprot:CAMPEP_0205902740 /NCGR_PEP_ID=MMETSP1083-20121108/28376_1 /ASSEMBLY_ACC=CAM_ASM_000430 /TAXON_ID=97485 /ORGANISM="Prymnesium parvum, Strain Texoma1" /LENGTH=69 /DNA_ID=CAMNT_0053268355 /DNA_START=182 /DNA_END=391 /DNA_ORIENTATION=+